MSTGYTIILLWVILLGSSGLAYYQINSNTAPNEFYGLLEKNIEFTGTIINQPTVSESGNQVLEFKPDGFNQSLRISLFHHAYTSMGDSVLVRGKLKQPENFSNFNYISYLKMKGIYAEVSSAQVLVLKPSESGFTDLVKSLRNWVVQKVRREFQPAQSGLILGMLIGYSDFIPKQVIDNYRRTGLTHILVVSGFNLTIIAISFGSLAWLIGRRLADFIALGLVWFFVILVGASSGVVRAGIMASLLIMARFTGRIHLSFYALLVAVLLISLINPLRLFFDVGFQLSIAATYGVLTSYRLRQTIQGGSTVMELLWSSIGAIVFTLPLVGFYFGTISLISPLANLLVLPSIPLLMLMGTLSLLPLIGEWIGVLLTLGLQIQLGLVQWLAKLPWSQQGWHPHLVVVFGYYLILLILVTIIKSRQFQQLKKPIRSAKITEVII